MFPLDSKKEGIPKSWPWILDVGNW